MQEEFQFPSISLGGLDLRIPTVIIHPRHFQSMGRKWLEGNFEDVLSSNFGFRVLGWVWRVQSYLLRRQVLGGAGYRKKSQHADSLK